ncbi:MAG: SIS domain-containing protein [Nocardioidaceae bacterium]
MAYFDDARLDDQDALASADPVLRGLAEAGARVRREAAEVQEALSVALDSGAGQGRPRAVVAAGPDSRLLRAVLEPWCPVPFVAWPNPSLPGWAGSLDLVVVLAPEGGDVGAASAIAEAVRRGCQVVVATPPRSFVAEHVVGRDAVLLPADSGDQLATAVVMLSYLSQVGLGPETDPEHVATALDDVAVACSPYVDQTENPAKLLAIGLADATPILWGGSVLAARAARRVAEAIRRSSGRAALAADAEHLLPILQGTAQRDVFADPFADPVDAAEELRPALVVFDDGSEDPTVREARGRLLVAADERGVRVETIASQATGDLARYAALLSSGRYAAAYLGLGLSTEDRTP